MTQTTTFDGRIGQCNQPVLEPLLRLAPDMVEDFMRGRTQLLLHTGRPVPADRLTPRVGAPDGSLPAGTLASIRRATGLEHLPTRRAGSGAADAGGARGRLTVAF